MIDRRFKAPELHKIILAFLSLLSICDTFHFFIGFVYAEYAEWNYKTKNGFCKICKEEFQKDPRSFLSILRCFIALVSKA
jgi:hypothetical protein